MVKYWDKYGEHFPYTCNVKPDRIANTVVDIGLAREFFLIQSKIMDGFDAQIYIFIIYCLFESHPIQ